MVHSVARCTIYERGVGVIFTVVDEDGPDVDENEQSDVGKLLQREQEWEDMVWNRLSESVDWMKSMRRKGRRHNPFVVGFMQVFVDRRVMQTAVNPVDQEIGE